MDCSVNTQVKSSHLIEILASILPQKVGPGVSAECIPMFQQSFLPPPVSLSRFVYLVILDMNLQSLHICTQRCCVSDVIAQYLILQQPKCCLVDDILSW